MISDSEVIRRSLASPADFAELFDRHARTIGAYAARRVGQDAGEDVLSETFLVAFRKRESFDQQASSSLPWLYGIASRIIRKHRATEARHWRSMIASSSREVYESSERMDELDARLDAETGVRRILPRIAKLPRGDREALLLYACDQLSYEEIANALSIPIGTVKSRLNRARKRLGLGARGTEGPVAENQRKGEGHGRSQART